MGGCASSQAAVKDGPDRLGHRTDTWHQSIHGAAKGAAKGGAAQNGTRSSTDVVDGQFHSELEHRGPQPISKVKVRATAFAKLQVAGSHSHHPLLIHLYKAAASLPILSCRTA